MTRAFTAALMAVVLAGCVAVPYYPEAPAVGIYAYPPPPATVYFHYHHYRR